MSNADRADRAYKALCNYISLASIGAPLDEPDEAAASDLIADLMHLFGHEAIDKAFTRGAKHYLVEKEEEEAP